MVVIDTKLPGLGPALLERIRTVTDLPITTIINTHTHEDHAGNNDFAATVTVIAAHEEAREDMKTLDGFADERAKFLPNRVFRDRLTLLDGADRIDLYYFGAAHTNGDALVVIPALRMMHAGDVFGAKEPPVIDPDHGGSAIRFAETLSKARAGIPGVDTVITGHGGVITWQEFEEFADFNADYLAWAKEQVKAGRDVDTATDGYVLPARYKNKGYRAASWRVKDNLKIVYKELTGRVPRASWWTRLRSRQ